jgi:hypothetical protein
MTMGFFWQLQRAHSLDEMLFRYPILWAVGEDEIGFGKQFAVRLDAAGGCDVGYMLCDAPACEIGFSKAGILKFVPGDEVEGGDAAAGRERCRD